MAVLGIKNPAKASHLVPPFTRARFQSLAVVQVTEPRTLYAHVKIDLGRQGSNHGYDHCQSYLPPQFTVLSYER